jgi:hypothetical protein
MDSTCSGGGVAVMHIATADLMIISHDVMVSVKISYFVQGVG